MVAAAPALSPALEARIWQVLEAVPDPEIPVVSITGLGIVRAVRATEDGTPLVQITPTYSACPAMLAIRLAVDTALAEAGIAPVKVETVLSPAWTTDWITAEARAALKAYGIAPPGRRRLSEALFGLDPEPVACPRCGSTRTERVSEFGSTACKAAWRCLACREPFEEFKCL